MDGVKLARIFTERDALNKVLASGLDPRTTKVSEVMTRNPYCRFTEHDGRPPCSSSPGSGFGISHRAAKRASLWTLPHAIAELGRAQRTTVSMTTSTPLALLATGWVAPCRSPGAGFGLPDFETRAVTMMRG